MKDSLFLSFIHFITRENNSSVVLRDYPELTAFLEVGDIGALEEIRDAFLFFKKQHFESSNLLNILKAFVKFIELEIIPAVDSLPISFFVSNEKERRSILDKVIQKESLSKGVIYDFILNASFEEVQNTIKNVIFKIYPERKNIMVQTARECNSELKNEIRTKFGDNSFVSFRVSKNLLGGMLTYKNGKIINSSWLGKIISLKGLRSKLNSAT